MLEFLLEVLERFEHAGVYIPNALFFVKVTQFTQILEEGLCITGDVPHNHIDQEAGACFNACGDSMGQFSIVR